MGYTITADPEWPNPEETYPEDKDSWERDMREAIRSEPRQSRSMRMAVAVMASVAAGYALGTFMGGWATMKALGDRKPSAELIPTQIHYKQLPSPTPELL